MPLPQKIRPETDPCRLAEKWTLDPRTASRLVQLSARVPFGFSIISGHRSVARQLELAREGRPAADPQRSTHTSCPATGADLRVDVAPVDTVKATLGAEAVRLGLRWGGGSPVDPGTGIPTDWNHFDLGPRR